ncbi:hypothetical protein DPX39_090057300 [Trypanosoma brucei equiperdum]|uniref:Uncharacterized protein n=1 Tax=Trypanosoma brucei equiperdum TaxID=630700 RepID=A0A3L6L0D1_9TRYP|nr:hypothetical protein DPX39_090057300 [Trypanosoma brucei equiperdum]
MFIPKDGSTHTHPHTHTS